MAPINIPAIEQRARELRAAEMRRLEDLFVARLATYAGLAGGTLLVVLRGLADTLRPLFSWNPHHHA